MINVPNVLLTLHAGYLDHLLLHYWLSALMHPIHTIIVIELCFINNLSVKRGKRNYKVRTEVTEQ